MKDKELHNILTDIQSSPDECEWVEIKQNNWKPELIGEYISALSNGAAYMGQSRAYLVFGLDDKTHNIVRTDFDYRKEKIGNQEIENWIATQLSPRIDFNVHELNTEKGKVVIFIIDSAGNTPVKFKGISYIRVGSYKKLLSDHPESACYQHCCLQFVSGEKMTNESFRGRLGIEAKNYSTASRIIADTIEARLVKPYSDNQSKKYAQYIPIWA